MVKIEFIESYIKMDDGDYQWSDNHGELIRCKDCKYYDRTVDRYGIASRRCLNNLDKLATPDDYCSRAEKR